MCRHILKIYQLCALLSLRIILLSDRDTTSSTGMGAGVNGNNQWEWEGNGNKTRQNMGLGMGMGMNHWEWEGMGLKKIFPLISNCLWRLALNDVFMSSATYNSTTSPITISSSVNFGQKWGRRRLFHCLPHPSPFSLPTNGVEPWPKRKPNSILAAKSGTYISENNVMNFVIFARSYTDQVGRKCDESRECVVQLCFL